MSTPKIETTACGLPQYNTLKALEVESLSSAARCEPEPRRSPGVVRGREFVVGAPPRTCSGGCSPHLLNPLKAAGGGDDEESSNTPPTHHHLHERDRLQLAGSNFSDHNVRLSPTPPRSSLLKSSVNGDHGGGGLCLGETSGQIAMNGLKTQLPLLYFRRFFRQSKKRFSI